MANTGLTLSRKLEVAPAPGRGPFAFGMLAFLGAGLSLAACFAEILITTFAPMVGLAVLAVNPHAQAAVMSVFALLGVIGLVRDSGNYASKIPLATGVFSFLLIAGTMYTYYDVRILMMGYTLLVVAAFLNQRFRLDELNRQVTAQADELRALNDSLENRVEDQVEEINRLARLKRFLAPAVAELITTRGEEPALTSHRAYISILFCDLRGFTAFSESMEPEEVIGVLQDYHEAMGRLVARHEATIDHRAGDGLMVFFNDPLPCDKPFLKAVMLALDMRREFIRLNENWKKIGYELGFGVGISGGYATMGVVGYEGRYDYTANGNVVNLAARFCDQAADGEILISHKACIEVEDEVQAEPAGEFEAKGFRAPVKVYRVIGLAEARPGRQAAGDTNEPGR